MQVLHSRQAVNQEELLKSVRSKLEKECQTQESILNFGRENLTTSEQLLNAETQKTDRLVRLKTRPHYQAHHRLSLALANNNSNRDLIEAPACAYSSLTEMDSLKDTASMIPSVLQMTNPVLSHHSRGQSAASNRSQSALR